MHPRRASAVRSLQDDGRVDISIRGKLRFPFRTEDLFKKRRNGKGLLNKKKKTPEEKALDDFSHVPRMNIAILITGSRGDVQPFIALSKVLQSPPYSHRVRIVTHPNFKKFVEENGVEFFSMGGDPEKLMAYMVRNPSILPSLASMKAGDVGMRRREIAEMLHGAWRGCTEAGDGMRPATDQDAPFVADAIIANPPSYAHIHIAEKLSIPLHMMFTMPWSPTTAFPHPLANLQTNKSSRKVANWTSYYEMDLLTWEGLSDLINVFRVRTLDLDPISPLWGHLLLTRLEVPFTYMWSPALIPKPADWGPHISISGFSFLSLASSFTPSPDLQAFLGAGPPPIYIGFGSIVVDDPQRLTDMVFEAIKISGVRALVSRGWGNMGGSSNTAPLPPNVLLIDNVPHDWLFPRVAAVVHHGGAGTTAVGIALGKPTVIVPFFGDQPWWAGMVHRAGAGPEPTPFRRMTAERLAASIAEALRPGMRQRAQELAARIGGEDGKAAAAATFAATPQMRGRACAVCPDRVAVWRERKTGLQLSAAAAVVLVGRGLVEPHDLTFVQHKRWYVEEGPPEPVSAIVGTLVGWARAYQSIFSEFKRDVAASRKNKKEKSRASKETTSALEKETLSSPSSTSPTPPPTASPPLNGTTATATPLTRIPTSHRTLQLSRPRKHNSDSHNHDITRALLTLASTVLLITFLRGPTALLYNVANGFHNAPSVLLRDPTVRVRPRIVDFPSGVRVAARECVYGVADAVAGAAVLPALGYRAAERRRRRRSGAKEGGGRSKWRGRRAAGVAVGAAQAVGGAAFKVGAAVVGPVGYVAKGVERGVSGWLAGRRGRRARFRVPDELGDAVVREKIRRLAERVGGHESVRAVGERRLVQGCWEVRRLRESAEGEAWEEGVVRAWEKMREGRRGSRVA